MTDHRVVAKWLFQLSQVVGSADPVSKEKILTMTTLLGEQYPDACYTTRSLEAVAAASPYWPTYADLVKRLGDWWKDNRPPEPFRLTDDRARGMNAMEQHWLAYWHTRVSEGFGPTHKTSVDDKTPDQREANALDLIRCQAPKVWERITGQKMPAGDKPAAPPQPQRAREPEYAA